MYRKGSLPHTIFILLTSKKPVTAQQFPEMKMHFIGISRWRCWSISPIMLFKLFKEWKKSLIYAKSFGLTTNLLKE
jgi:hypothetical protein